MGERRICGVAGDALGLVVAGGAGLAVELGNLTVQVYRPADGMIGGCLAPVAALAVVAICSVMAEDAPLVNLRLSQVLAMARNPERSMVSWSCRIKRFSMTPGTGHGFPKA